MDEPFSDEGIFQSRSPVKWVPDETQTCVAWCDWPIGESALKVARDIPERMEIIGLAASERAQAGAQANLVRPSVCLVDESQIRSCAGARLQTGRPDRRGLRNRPPRMLIWCWSRSDWGSRPALAAIEAGRPGGCEQGDFGMAGDRDARSALKGVGVLPVDSNTTQSSNAWKAGFRFRHHSPHHSTASGGPFREMPNDCSPALPR
jgi:1-deoxy-D-xylulose-5-phosphate reductoisomerase